MPVLSKRAEKMVADLPGRLRALNDDPRYLHKVTRAAVFGSFLTDKPVLGDVDFAVDWRLRKSTLNEEDTKQFRRDFPPPQRVASSFEESLFWEDTKFVRDMRVGNLMSVHTFDELLRLKCPYRLIFEE